MSKVRTNMRAVMRTQNPLLSVENIWKDKYVLLRELMEFMTPLFILIRSQSTSLSRYYVLVPPDEELADFIAEGESATNTAVRSVRCAQSAVRAHILHGGDPHQLSSLLGFTGCLELSPPSLPQGDGEQPTLFASLGSVTVTDAHGNSIRAMIQAIEQLPPVTTFGDKEVDASSANSSCSFLFVDRAVYTNQRQRPKQPLTAKLLAQKCRMSMIPVWQRLPNSAAIFLSNANVKDVSSDALESKFLADEKSFRTLISDFAAEKIETLENPSDKKRVAQLVDTAMMQLETEVTIFQSSYVCIPGYEQFIVAKVLQVIETAVETALDIKSEEGQDFDSCYLENDEGRWTEDEKEQMIVAVHTVVCGAVAPKVLLHWENVNHNEDFAFNHACWSLQQSLTLAELLRVPNIEQVSPSHFDPAVAVVSVLNSRSLSVFTLMRVMETTISVVVELLQSCGVLSDVTADLCIPLIVFVIVQTRPTALPSRIKYILDMSIPSLEMSSLGYALTTFEAATAHVLQEYRDRVANR